MKLLEFACLGHRFAVPVATVARILPCAQPALLPGAPAVVIGALALGGEVLVLVDAARRFGLGQTRLAPHQRIVVVPVRGFLLGIVSDDEIGVTEREAGTSLPAHYTGDSVAGMVVADDGLRVLLDPEQVLLREDDDTLRRALEAGGHA
jgi:purine-binding chemotaxis protein CheW